MRFGWISDIHLNFLDESRLRTFLEGLSFCDVNAWLLGGDIGQADSVLDYLRILVSALPCKLYFTLGNHDFYGGSIEDVRGRVRQLVGQSTHLVWLTDSDPQVLTDGVTVVGDDSWADARFGNALGTSVELNDFFAIENLVGLSRKDLVCLLNKLGDEAAARLAPKLQRAAACSRQVVLLTHVPPFWGAAWHQGRPSTEDWIPWFSCRAVGEVIVACANAHPNTDFLVLCGHTHGSGIYCPTPSVTVHTAEAEYGAPRVQRIFELGAHAQSGDLAIA